MFTIVVILHVITCMGLIFIILLQRGRGAEMGATFGGSSQTLFGASGGLSFINKLTTGLAIFFFITSLSLTYLASHRTTEPKIKSIPAVPAVPEKKQEMPHKTTKTPQGLTEKVNSDKK
ncbi:MAG: preprotein translocase subunit SecG [Candidatus Desulfofervidaceae bacterium]|nr:preprotein translocase subunit SecG [Candidatus Desulfofervidaceae bacterium]